MLRRLLTPLLTLLLECSGMRYEINGRYNFTIYERRDIAWLDGSGVSDQQEVYRWKNRDEYYYTDIKTKLEGVLLRHDGTGCHQSFQLDSDNSMTSPRNSSYIKVSTFPPSDADVAYWRSMTRPAQMRVEPFLCANVYSKRTPIFNNTRCQLPTYMHIASPRCQTKYLLWICESSKLRVDDSTLKSRFVLPESDHGKADLPPVPYLISARDAFVSMCGQISTRCGSVMPTANCMAAELKPAGLTFDQKVRKVRASGLTMMQQMPLPVGTPYDDNFIHVGRVFIAAQTDDSYVYHAHLEIFSRILYHSSFLVANSDVMILWGCDSKKDKRRTEAGLRHGFAFLEPLLALAGINSSRVIKHRNVHADVAYMPSDGACQDPVYNTWHLLAMRNFFYRSLGISRDTLPATPLLILLKRSANARATRNGHDSVRQWSDAFTERVAQSIRQVRVLSDKDEKTMNCHTCQVKLFSQARVLVGVHGAGLANMLYMPKNAAVMELCPYANDGRCLLGGGPFSRLSSVLSHNYAIHHPPYSEFKWIGDLSSEFNVTRLTQHLASFLTSINFVSGAQTDLSPAI